MPGKSTSRGNAGKPCGESDKSAGTSSMQEDGADTGGYGSSNTNASEDQVPKVIKVALSELKGINHTADVPSTQSMPPEISASWSLKRDECENAHEEEDKTRRKSRRKDTCGSRCRPQHSGEIDVSERRVCHPHSESQAPTAKSTDNAIHSEDSANASVSRSTVGNAPSNEKDASQNTESKDEAPASAATGSVCSIPLCENCKGLDDAIAKERASMTMRTNNPSHASPCSESMRRGSARRSPCASVHDSVGTAPICGENKGFGIGRFNSLWNWSQRIALQENTVHESDESSIRDAQGPLFAPASPRKRNGCQAPDYIVLDENPAVALPAEPMVPHEGVEMARRSTESILEHLVKRSVGRPDERLPTDSEILNELNSTADTEEGGTARRETEVPKEKVFMIEISIPGQANKKNFDIVVTDENGDACSAGEFSASSYDIAVAATKPVDLIHDKAVKNGAAAAGIHGAPGMEAPRRAAPQASKDRESIDEVGRTGSKDISSTAGISSDAVEYCDLKPVKDVINRYEALSSTVQE